MEEDSKVIERACSNQQVFIHVENIVDAGRYIILTDKLEKKRTTQRHLNFFPQQILFVLSQLELLSSSNVAASK